MYPPRGQGYKKDTYELARGNGRRRPGNIPGNQQKTPRGQGEASSSAAGYSGLFLTRPVHRLIERALQLRDLACLPETMQGSQNHGPVGCVLVPARGTEQRPRHAGSPLLVERQSGKSGQHVPIIVQSRPGSNGYGSVCRMTILRLCPAWVFDPAETFAEQGKTNRVYLSYATNTWD